jgi:hypothetical protein
MEKYLSISKILIILALLFNSSGVFTFHNQNKLYFGQSRLALELNSTGVEPFYFMESLQLKIDFTAKDEEIWKDISGYEGYYQVSNLGRVKSLNYNHTKKEKLLHSTENRDMYLRVGLYKNGKPKIKRVHQLVAESFLNHKICGHKLVVNHKDFNKQNNHVDNLEIVTQRENANKKHINSSSRFVGVSWHKENKKWQVSIWINGKLKYIGSFTSELEASSAYETELSKIEKINTTD